MSVICCISQSTYWILHFILLNHCCSVFVFKTFGNITNQLVGFTCQFPSLKVIDFLHLLEKQNTFHFTAFSIFFLSTTFSEYLEIRSESYCTDHQTANTIQLFVAKNGKGS